MVIFEFTMTYLKSLMQCLAHSGLLYVVVVAIIYFMTGQCLDGILRASLWQGSMSMYFMLRLAPAFKGMNL